MKVFIECVDLACMEICRIQKVVTVRRRPRCAFVNSAVNAVVRAVIDGDDGVRLIQVWVPTRYGTSSLTKMKAAGAVTSILCHLEERRVLNTTPVGLPPSLFRAAVGISTTSERAVPS